MPNPTKRKVQVHVAAYDPDTGEPKFLILLRPAARGGFWQPVTGNVEPGESCDDAAGRELREETCVSYVSRWRKVGQFEFEKNGNSFCETVFLAEVNPCEITLSREHVQCRWETYEKARELIAYESNKLALDNVARLLREEA